jgi:hypothetical protein
MKSTPVRRGVASVISISFPRGPLKLHDYGSSSQVTASPSPVEVVVGRPPFRVHANGGVASSPVRRVLHGVVASP